MHSTAEIIHRLRELGFTQMEISRRTGIPQPRLSRWGGRGAPDYVDDALRLAAFLAQVEAGEQKVA